MLVVRPAGAERLPLRAYTVADGLAHNRVNKILRDRRGLIWLATADGLSRFDGYTFTTFGVEQGLPHPIVNDLIETRSGEIWVATRAGLARFDPRARPTFTAVTADDRDSYAQVVTALLEAHDGTIWCGTLKGLHRLERSPRLRLTPIELPMPAEAQYLRFVNDLVEDRHHSIWIAAPSGLYRLWPDGRRARYTEADGLPDAFLHDLLVDANGRLWVATRHHGFFRVEADASRAAPVVRDAADRAQGLPTGWMFQLYQGRDGRFWIGANTGLVERVPAPNGGPPTFRAWSRKNGLTFAEVTALEEDAAGNLWLGTNATGAMRLARNGLVTYDEADGLVGVDALFEDAAGTLCLRGVRTVSERSRPASRAPLPPPAADATIIGAQAFGCFEGTRLTWFEPEAPFEFGWAGQGMTMRAPNDEWWIGGGNGVYRFPPLSRFTALAHARPATILTVRDGLKAPQTFRTFADSGGRIWISSPASPHDLLRWDPATRKVTSLASAPGLPSLHDEMPRAFGEDAAGNVWVGLNTGVARYRDGAFTFFGRAAGLAAGGILDIHRDREGRLWLASSRGGLLRVDEPGAEHPTFRAYTTADGLSSNQTEVVTDDLRGLIYVATSRGLNRLDPVTGRVRPYTTADGLAEGEIVAAFRDRHGALWFGTHRGLSRLTPEPTAPPAPAPSIFFTGLSVGGRPHLVSATGETALTLQDLPPDRHQLEIEFAATASAPGDVLRYQFRLDGADDRWSTPAAHRRVNYAGLAPGRYRFLVRAVNGDGVASATPASLQFAVLPPLWQRWWFMSLVGLLIGATAYAFYHYRVAHLVALERMRTRIAGDLHDDIGANLTKISILSEVARRQPGDGDEPGGALSTIARLARESVASMSDIVWAVDPRRDSLQDVVRRMRLHAEETCVARDIALEFVAPEGGLAASLGVDVRRDLYLIFKEALNNAARHSDCTHIRVTLTRERGRLSLSIRDNGHGFDAAAAHDGNGVLNMRRRAQARGATLDIASGPSAGTAVSLTLPA
jgi:ligand-binding sensor domain-containing protein